MRALLVGNHACSNRGDAAILRGLLAGLASARPDARIDVISRYPVSAGYLLGRPVGADPLWAFRRRDVQTRLGRLRTRETSRLMLASLRRPMLRLLLPAPISETLARLAKYDAVIHVGGSFFVDLYGAAQYDWPLVSFLAGVPYLLMGHSLGPFESSECHRFAAALLEHARFVGLRESASRDALVDASLRHDHVYLGSDTAWLVPADPGAHARDGLRVEPPRPLIAVTARELAPFDARLDLTQNAYELGLARMIDQLIGAGFDVVLASTCTGLDSYHRDDRMVALRVRARLSHPSRCQVTMDELGDVELGELFASCALVISTRLHGAILAMNFGTPAAALIYEHKAQGTMAQLGLADLAFSLASVLDGSALPKLVALARGRERLALRVREAVLRERTRARAMLDAGLATLAARRSGDAHGGGASGRPPPTDPRVGDQGQRTQDDGAAD